MTESSCAVPPGFRFHPTDEELVGYYLRKKVASHKIDLDVIREIDLYRIEPWDLQDKCRIGYEEQKEWYFFSHKDKKYPTGTRTNRATMAGFWKATGRDKAVYDKAKLIGMRKTLVFYKGRAPNGHKTDWIMHEYRLESQDNHHPQEEGWVVCRAFKKRMTSQTKTNNINKETYYYQPNNSATSGVSSSSIEYITRQHDPPPNCKQETEAASDQFLHFVELPPLESPSLAQSKSTEIIEITDEQCNDMKGNSNIKNVMTDWRDLDKFVASQLSHGDPMYEVNHGISSFEVSNGDHSDLGLLLPQSGCDEGSKLNELLSSTSVDSFDIGICIYNK